MHLTTKASNRLIGEPLKLEPMDLIQVSAPFDDPDFLYEVKFDGFRALAYVEGGQCKLVSRKGHIYRRFADLCQAIAAGLKVQNCILDGEIVCLDDQGRSRFHDLMFHRGEPYFYAFDLVWKDGVDLRELPLVERKANLKELVPHPPSRLLYLDHVEDQGVELFTRCCKLDLEGIVAKPKDSPYWKLDRKPLWIKVKNPDYTLLGSAHSSSSALAPLPEGRPGHRGRSRFAACPAVSPSWLQLSGPGQDRPGCLSRQACSHGFSGPRSTMAFGRNRIALRSRPSLPSTGT